MNRTERALEADAPPDVLVFGTSTGNRHGQSNIRRRLLAPAAKAADARLLAAGLETLPAPLTPRSHVVFGH